MPSSRLAISLDEADDRRLRMAAAEHGTSVGVVVRALIKHGLAQLQAGDADVRAAVDEERAAERARRAEVGRRAMEIRYKEKRTKRGSRDGAQRQDQEDDD